MQGASNYWLPIHPCVSLRCCASFATDEVVIQEFLSSSAACTIVSERLNTVEFIPGTTSEAV